MNIVTQNVIDGITTYTLTEYGFALINELFRTVAFIAAVFLFLLSFYIFYRIMEK
jgi:Co/Zn/Cd efflux system component